MASSSEKSILIAGAGIAGLCLGVAALARGFAVTVVARDALADTASGVAAGMIAPVLEARGEGDQTFDRLKAAQSAWIDLMDAWPPEVQSVLHRQQADAQSRYVWTGDIDEGDAAFLARHGQRLAGEAFAVAGDWLVQSTQILTALDAHFTARGGGRITGEISEVSAHVIHLADGREWHGDHVVIAAGYGARGFAAQVPSLGVLRPIKGHLLDLAANGAGQGVVRSATGYLASYGTDAEGGAKFGASMQPDQDDLGVEPDVVAGLEARARAMFPDMTLDGATPRVGVRASTPDGWPLIGRDSASGVWIATGMRRNGFIFAPYAAQVILDEIEGVTRPDAAIYAPGRFA